MKGLTTCLWFNDQAEAAASFYTSIFKHSKVGTITHYGVAGSRASGRPEGSVMTVEFEIAGQKFMGLNGGPDFPFSEAVSFVVNCSDQDEIDEYWTRLTEAGGSPGPCGWLKDKFGLSWQIVPTELAEMLADEDPAKRERVMTALLGMQKLDLETLKQAYKGEPLARREGSTVRV
jgi:predicted 3-demethylubiquinone-9 3-methyltransferase (glyoxalase superfamily)